MLRLIGAVIVGPVSLRTALNVAARTSAGLSPRRAAIAKPGADVTTARTAVGITRAVHSTATDGIMADAIGHPMNGITAAVPISGARVVNTKRVG